MNLFQLVLKQMRQRALGTALTLLSVMLGVALAVAVLLMKRESGRLFGQTDFGYEVLVGPPKGSPLQLTLNTVYHMDRSAGNVPYAVYEDLARRKREPGKPYYAPYVRLAVPFMVGDSYNGRRIVGTSPAMFGFDEDGKPLEGYDAKGRLLPNYQDADVPDDERDANRPVAGAAMKFRRDKKYVFAEGRSFAARKLEAVIGSDVAQTEHLKVGSTFKATHGMPAPGEVPDVHALEWTVVGILEPTHTANDRVLFIPFITLYAIEEHSSGLIKQAMIKAGINPDALTPEQVGPVLEKLGFDLKEIPASVLKKFKMAAPRATSRPAPAPSDDLLKPIAPPPPAAAAEGKREHDEEEPPAYHLDDKGNVLPDLPQDEWEVSAILVKTRGPFQTSRLLYDLQVGRQDAAAANPASVMREFFETFLRGSIVLLVALAALVSVVAAIGILVSIYNSVSARQKEIAVLRALGATKRRILTIICVEAGLIGLIGGALGLVAGHALAGVGSIYFERTAGESINWLTPSRDELQYLAVVVLIAVLAGLVPALKAYRTPVATNLVAS
jgi:putative ABC transport system permease protein